MAKGVVFLDRDGVLVKAFEGRPANTVGEIELLPGVPEGMRELKQAGLRTVMVSNQGGVDLGYMTIDVLKAMNERLNDLLILAKAPPIDAFYWCAHALREGCECRKPRPGMFIRAQEDLPIDLGASYMVGDDVRDMECVVTAGLKHGIMVVSDRYQDTPHARFVVANLERAAEAIILLEKGLRK